MNPLDVPINSLVKVAIQTLFEAAAAMAVAETGAVPFWKGGRYHRACHAELLVDGSVSTNRHFLEGLDNPVSVEEVLEMKIGPLRWTGCRKLELTGCNCNNRPKRKQITLGLVFVRAEKKTNNLALF